MKKKTLQSSILWLGFLILVDLLTPNQVYTQPATTPAELQPAPLQSVPITNQSASSHEPDKAQGDPNNFTDSLTWLSNSPISLSHASKDKDARESIEIALYEVQLETGSRFIFTLSDSKQERFLLFQVSSYESFSTSRGISEIKNIIPHSSVKETPQQIQVIYNQIDAWIKENIEWDEFRKKLSRLTTDLGSEFDIQIVDFKKLKKYQPVPSSIILNGDPEKIEDYTIKNYSYITDQRNFGITEYWQSVEEFVTHKRGDCEDFANFMDTLLKLNNFPSFILNIYTSSLGHSVVVYKKNGMLHIMDATKKFKQTHARTLSELIRKIAPRWKRAMIVEYSEEHHRGRVLKEIRKAKKL